MNERGERVNGKREGERRDNDIARGGKIQAEAYTAAANRWSARQTDVHKCVRNSIRRHEWARESYSCLFDAAAPYDYVSIPNALGARVTPVCGFSPFHFESDCSSHALVFPLTTLPPSPSRLP